MKLPAARLDEGPTDSAVVTAPCQHLRRFWLLNAKNEKSVLRASVLWAA